MNRTQINAAHSSGVTIIELMVGITVLGVLLGIGVPSFQNLIRNQRLATQTNSVVAALNYARAEVATRSLPVAVCAASDETFTACGESTNWANGWIIFTDRTGDPGVLEQTDEVLQTGQPPAGGFEIEASEPFVRFSVRPSENSAQSFVVRPESDRICASTGTREIAVEVTGRVSTTKSTC